MNATRKILTLSLVLAIWACQTDADVPSTADPHAAMVSEADPTVDTAEDSLADATGWSTPDDHPEVEAFLRAALAGEVAEGETMTYEVVRFDGGRLVVDTVEVGVVLVPDGTIVDATDISLIAFSRCVNDPAGNTARRAVIARSCNRQTALNDARSWAVRLALDECDTEINHGNGPSVCNSVSSIWSYTEDTCAYNSTGSYTSIVQQGSSTACGIWPFRHARWSAVYDVTVSCGFYCRTQ
jgi:hypothetical protein